MKPYKLMLAGSLLFLFPVIFTGCGTPASPNDSVLEIASKKVSEAKNIEADAVYETGVVSEVNGEKSPELLMTLNMHFTMFDNPVKSKISSTLSSSLGTSSNLQEYTLEQNGIFVKFFYMDTAPQNHWEKQSVCKADDKSAKDKVQKLDPKIFMNHDYPYERQKDAEEDGKTYQVYTCSMTSEMIVKLVKGTALGTQSITNDELLTEIADSADDMGFSLWIDPEKEELYRVKVSLKEINNKILENPKLEKLPEGFSGREYTKADLDIRYRNYNKAEDFTLPEEALKAKEIPIS